MNYIATLFFKHLKLKSRQTFKRTALVNYSKSLCFFAGSLFNLHDPPDNKNNGNDNADEGEDKPRLFYDPQGEVAPGGEGDRAAKATRIFHCVGHIVRAVFLAVDGVLRSIECLI